VRPVLRSVRAALAGPLLALAACSPALPPESGTPAAFLEIQAVGAEAQSKYEAGRWQDAAVLYRKQAEAASSDPNLGGWRDQALYNLACVLARDGKAAEAAAAFAECLAEGLRPPLAPARGGGWVPLANPISLPHVLADPDLDAIRDQPAYRDVLHGFLSAGEEHVAVVGPADAGRRPALVVLVRLRGRAVPEGEAPPPAVPKASDWLEAAGARPVVVAALAPPVRPHPTRDVEAKVTRDGMDLHSPPVRAWLLGDGDDRWAVAKVRETIDRLAARPDVDPERIYVVAPADDAEAAIVAWAAALAMPERIAGVAVPGGLFRRIAWADALAAVPSKREGRAPWKVVLTGSDVAAETSLRDAGIGSERAVPTDGPAGVLEFWLGR
jgi:hypothetical protein